MSGRNAPRSKNGCSTCRRRKVKCGEEQPVCKRCLNLRLSCEWGIPVKRGRSAQIRHLQPAPTTGDLTIPERAWPTSDAGDITDLDFDLDLDLDLPHNSPHPHSHSHHPHRHHPQAHPHPHPHASSHPHALLDGLSPVSWPGDAVSVTLDVTPQLPAFYSPAAAPTPTSINPTPLYPPLSTNNKIVCANSLTLTEHDHKYFQYFPSSSIVYYYMKGWNWSSFCYLYEGPATTNKVIMRMILALAASDMHRDGLVVRSPGRPTAEDHGRYHYSLAVKEFRQLLETPRRDVSTEELEIIFATMFLMVTYEWQFGNSVRHLQLHLHGVRSLLESHPQLFRVKDINDVFLPTESDTPNTDNRAGSKLSFIPEQFLLWILYIDASARPMGLTESLNDYVTQSKNPALQPDHLHRCARLWGRCFWGEQYPDQEVLDDIENYRALELLHRGFLMRHRTWKMLVDPAAGPDSTASLFQEIIAIRDNYSDLFITAKFAGPVSARRTLNTIYMAVCTFYAQIILHRRLLCVDTPPTAIHKQALAGILNITRKQFASDSRPLRRLHWPLLMAVIETDDPNHRAWVRQRLLELRSFHSEYLWANEIADQILAQQDVSPGCYANLAELLLQRLHVQ